MTSKNPRVLAISLNHLPWFDEVYSPLLDALKSKTDFQRAFNVTSAVRLLSLQSEPHAVLLTDDALSLPQHWIVWEIVLGYIRRGGTAVVMGLFSSFVKPKNVKRFFSKAGLSWTNGSYHRTILMLNRAVIDKDVAAKLSPAYSQKATFVGNVASQDMWYRTNQYSVTDSLVFAPSSAHVPGETAVALAKVGAGKLGYIGDVNAEEGSHLVVLAMCGLL